MKRITLTAAFFAAATINMFGAACPAGTNTLAALIALPAACQISASNDSSLSWSISNWALTAASTTGFGSGAPVTVNTNDILVSVNSLTNGFSITFSDASNAQAGSNPYNFFAPAATAGNSQQVNWKTGYWVRAVGAGASDSATGVDNVILSLQNPTGSDSFSVDKQFQDFNGINLTPTDAQVFYSNGAYILGTTNPSSPTSVFNPRRTAGISIVDVVQFNSGQNGSGSVDSYTNTFSITPPSNGVPEPMSFVLMGAGLVGIAALRRRKA
jgi:hypothetical protein